MNNSVKRWALVTGASSGLGALFASQLWNRGFNLVLCARRIDRLEKSRSDMLAQRSDGDIHAIQCDLSKEQSRIDLFNEINGKSIEIDVLINNAGLGYHRRFGEITWDECKQIIDVNISCLTHLTKLFSQGMIERRRGYILNVASVAAFVPMPLFQIYAASKAYVRMFSQAIHADLGRYGIVVCALCPGHTPTEFQKVAGSKTNAFSKLTCVQPEQVVQTGLEALFEGRSSVTPGIVNKLVQCVMACIPSFIAAKFATIEDNEKDNEKEE